MTRTETEKQNLILTGGASVFVFGGRSGTASAAEASTAKPKRAVKNLWYFLALIY